MRLGKGAGALLLKRNLLSKKMISTPSFSSA